MLLTILLVTTFSFLSIYILEIKTFQSDTQTKNYYQIQAAFHMELAKNIIKNIELNNNNKPCIEEINIPNENYEIYASIRYISLKNNCTNSQAINLDVNNSNGVAIIDVYTKSKSTHFKIQLHERFLKKL